MKDVKIVGGDRIKEKFLSIWLSVNNL